MTYVYFIMFRNFFLLSVGSYTGHLLEFPIILLKKRTVDYSSNHVLARLKTDAENPVQQAVAKLLGTKTIFCLRICYDSPTIWIF